MLHAISESVDAVNSIHEWMVSPPLDYQVRALVCGPPCRSRFSCLSCWGLMVFCWRVCPHQERELAEEEARGDEDAANQAPQAPGNVWVGRAKTVGRIVWTVGKVMWSGLKTVYNVYYQPEPIFDSNWRREMAARQVRGLRARVAGRG